MSTGGGLRILHIASGDAWGGAERVLLLLVEGTLQSGEASLDVVLLNEGRLSRALRDLGAQVHVIPESGRSFAQLQRSVREWLADRHFDAIHAHRYKEILLAALAPKRARDRLVVTVHGFEPRSQLTLRQLLRVWAILVAARLRGACFATVSEELAHRLARRLGRAHVVAIGNPVRESPSPEPVPDLRERFQWSAEQPLVGFVGRLVEVKGPDRFIELVRGLPESHRGVIIGSGPLRAELESRVAEHRLGERVAFVGEVPDALGYLSQLDVLALTSRHEGVPMVLLEAAICHVPVAAFGVGGVADIAPPGAGWRVVPEGDIAAMTRSVHEILAAPESVRDDCAQRADWVKNHSGLSRIVRRYVSLYRGHRPDAPPSRYREASARTW